MTREEFNQQQLPKSDIYEDLETLSRNKLKAMVVINDFRLRDDCQDKGIDLFMEIKTNNSNTNLRFPIQLKATQTVKKNKDLSISYRVDVSNINYLMNDGLPGYYLLYLVAEDIFYYEKAVHVEEQLLSKYIRTTYPESFTIRFSKKLDQKVLQNIHSEVLSLGYLRRNLNGMIKLQPGNEKIEDTLVITKNQGVYSVDQRIKLLEKHGFRLLNEAKFQMITEFEKTCHPVDKASSAFHFICGTAYHYQGQMYKALEHYKQAAKNKADLNSEIQNILRYYTLQSKRSLGMIDVEETRGQVESLMNSEYLGLFLKLEKAYSNFYVNELAEPFRSETFNQIIGSVSNDPKCDKSMQLIAESYALMVEGHKLNDKLINYLLTVRAIRANPFVDLSSHKPPKDEINNYNVSFEDLKSRAFDHSNHYTYYLICLNDIKIQYMMDMVTDIILGADETTLTIVSKLGETDIKKLTQQAKFVGQIAEAYHQLNSPENVIAALAQQYEILHFIKNMTEAQKVLMRIEEILSEYDLHGLESKLNFLKNKGTAHEDFEKLILKSLGRSQQERKEATLISNKIVSMDKEDQERVTSSYTSYQIQILPLGIYNFAEMLLEPVLEVLQITEEAKAGYRHMLDMGVIPIANAYNNPIVKEGYANGEYDNKGIDSMRNLEKVRVGLRKLGAYLVIPKFRGAGT